MENNQAKNQMTNQMTVIHVERGDQLVHVEGIVNEVGVEDNNFDKRSRPPDTSKRRLVEDLSVNMRENEVVSLMSSE